MNFSKLAVEDERLTSSLGGLTNGASPVEMAAAYATLENDGDYRMPTCIVKITDAQGNVVVSTTQEAEKIYKTTAARMVTNMMQTVIQEGTGRGLGVSNMPSAGKTGTTNDNKDGWFAGYTPYYTASIWVGFDMPEKLPGLTGSSYPGEIWHTFMENRHQGLAPVEFLPYVQADTYEKELDLQRETQEQGEDSPESPDNGDGDVLQENSSPGDGGLQDG